MGKDMREEVPRMTGMHMGEGRVSTDKLQKRCLRSSQGCVSRANCRPLNVKSLDVVASHTSGSQEATAV
jgi:hypothetical protein